MNMKMSEKYVKLIARLNTWFIEGTEVYSYDCDPPEDIRRMTLDEWESYNNFACLVIGRRIPKLSNEIEIFGEGERWDVEYCQCDEFDVEIVDDLR
jgi:hypothetical protein